MLNKSVRNHSARKLKYLLGFEKIYFFVYLDWYKQDGIYFQTKYTQTDSHGPIDMLTNNLLIENPLRSLEL